MCTESNHTREACKQVIDYNKVVISLSSTIMAAQLGFLVFQNNDFYFVNYLSSILLVISILLSLIGFGKSIRVVKTGQSDRKGILFTNLGAYSLIIGIMLIGLIGKGDNSNVDKILTKIEDNTTKIFYKLEADKCIKIEFTGDSYSLNYKIDTVNIEVDYSIKKDRIMMIKPCR